MKHDDLASAELLDVIEKTKQFLAREKERGYSLIEMKRETWNTLEAAVQRACRPAGGADIVSQLKQIEAEVAECTKCPLSRTRTQTVFSDGDPHAKLMFIGEAPGADEDAQGVPFVGKAGQLLTRIIEAIDLKRSGVYICNIIKCRPPGNRTPTSIEIESCMPYLMQQLDLIKPRIICALGNSAAQTLLNTKAPMNRLRGKFHKYGDALLMPTYHPAALLRNPAYKKDVWEDVQIIQREYEKL
jgi:DNA polymerase